MLFEVELLVEFPSVELPVEFPVVFPVELPVEFPVEFPSDVELADEVEFEASSVELPPEVVELLIVVVVVVVVVVELPTLKPIRGLVTPMNSPGGS